MIPPAVVVLLLCGSHEVTFVVRFANHLLYVPTIQPTNQQKNQLTNQQKNQLTNQPANYQTNQKQQQTIQPTNQWTHQTTNSPTN